MPMLYKRGLESGGIQTPIDKFLQKEGFLLREECLKMFHFQSYVDKVHKRAYTKKLNR
jgi:hypothetical protein